ncbi:Mov34/MPN/PAD-1 family protein [Paraburkholderia sp. USG1]|uniref:Mov34/MPN/PAD-1 family protein n=1 Tax=Paraburkholderia sp. USG1 TaxID=2952268 RepID=UPI00285BD2B2|nr:Mov34/MPN/PAD-1 family protein [Paraburkholderia sp. USG1]MDR8398008.1 Mov34/MPN/PAD-1 family protein [Paraburkholderia sp. USG1]
MDMLNHDNLQCIYRHASRTYPEECCGFVFADGTVHHGVNIQSELNRRQPDIHTRTGANGYTFSVADTLAMNRSFQSGNPATVIYHSHPDVGAYFSHEDENKALFMGKPAYPVAYLVVDVRAGHAKGAKLFQWNGKCFACVQEIHAGQENPAIPIRS